MYYFCDEIVPFTIMLAYVYRLKNDFETNLEDVANDLLQNYEVKKGMI